MSVTYSCKQLTQKVMLMLSKKNSKEMSEEANQHFDDLEKKLANLSLREKSYLEQRKKSLLSEPDKSSMKRLFQKKVGNVISVNHFNQYAFKKVKTENLVKRTYFFWKIENKT